MKTLKSLIFISSFLIPTALHAEQNNNKQVNSKQTSTKQSANQNSKTTQKKNTSKADQSLNNFNKAFGIKLVARNITTDNAGQSFVIFTYELENRSKKDIKSASWISGYTLNQQVIFTQELPLTFNPALKAQTVLKTDISIPLTKIPEHARQILLDPNAPIGVINAAQSLTFTKGAPINVK